MATIFSRIVVGEIPCHKVAEDEEFFAFLDINPLAVGHTLIVPREEIDYFFDISNEKMGRMMVFAKKVSVALARTVPCRKVGLSVIGLEVPHAHIHLVPLNKEEDIHFGKLKITLSSEELATLAAKIRENF
ncbi:MAG: HIT family protein [Tannerellaceae bacterium]|jgi:histidine triad (HIT) family protein|nr:HIT family protein [Tannerellaceae bacterium]